MQCTAALRCSMEARRTNPQWIVSYAIVYSFELPFVRREQFVFQLTVSVTLYKNSTLLPVKNKNMKS